MRKYPGIDYKLDMKKPMSDGNVNSIEAQLSKLGFLSSKYIDGWFDLYTDRAVRSYQIANNIIPTGVVDKKVWELLFANENSTIGSDVNSDSNSNTTTNGNQTNNGTSGNDYFVSKNESAKIPEHKYDGSGKHTPYFNEYNSKQLRKTDLEMRIDFGANHPMSKTIKHIYMRSAGIEVDASGNPLYETFEFIAQDVLETGNEFKNN